MSEMMAVARNVGFGMRDFTEPGLWFDVRPSEAIGALQCFHGQEALDIIKQSGVHDVKNLNGKVCWVEKDGNILRFKRWCDV